MANFWYNEAKRAIARGEIDWQAADIRAMLVMTSTTAHTEDDANVLADFTDLDEYDGSGYTAGGAALASKVVNENSGANRAEMDAADVVFASLGAGTRQAKALLLYKFVTGPADSVPLCYIDTGNFPFAGNGSNVTVQWNAAGVAQVA